MKLTSKTSRIKRLERNLDAQIAVNRDFTSQIAELRRMVGALNIRLSRVEK